MANGSSSLAATWKNLSIPVGFGCNNVASAGRWLGELIYHTNPNPYGLFDKNSPAAQKYFTPNARESMNGLDPWATAQTLLKGNTSSCKIDILDRAMHTYDITSRLEAGPPPKN